MAERRRQQRRIGFATPGIAAGGQRAERVAVIALPPRDEVLALRLAGLEEILPRELDRGFDRLRAAADEIDVSEPAGLVANQMIGERLRGFGGEEGRVSISKLRGLLRHRLDHARMLVAEAGHRGAAGGIEHLPAVLGEQPDTFAADRLRRRLAQASMQHAALGGHDDQPLSVTYCDSAARRASVSSKALLRARTTQRKCDRGQRLRDRDRAGQAREESGRGCRFIEQQMIGALRHRRGNGIRDRDQARAGAMRGARRQHARGRIRVEADDDDRIAVPERAEVEIFRSRTADELHVVGPEQAKLVIEQLRDAAAAAKASDPDPPRRMQRPRRFRDHVRRNARKARGFCLELVGNQRHSALGPWRRPRARPENGEDCAGRRASVNAARNSSQPE